jgi:hypothetical protein
LKGSINRAISNREVNIPRMGCAAITGEFSIYRVRRLQASMSGYQITMRSNEAHIFIHQPNFELTEAKPKRRRNVFFFLPHEEMDRFADPFKGK